MKLPVLLLLSLLAIRPLAAAELLQVNFHSVVSDGGAPRFSLHFTNPRETRRHWCTLGDEVEGYRVAAYDGDAHLLTLARGANNFIVALQSAMLLSGTAEPPALALEERLRLAKQQFDQGRRIRAEVAFLSGDDLVVRDLDLAPNGETTLDAGTLGTLHLKAELNPDGTLTYHLRLVAPAAPEKPEDVRFRTRVRNTPWGSFFFSVKDGGSLAFVPYE